jgi:hypothetical protein
VSGIFLREGLDGLLVQFSGRKNSIAVSNTCWKLLEAKKAAVNSRSTAHTDRALKKRRPALPRGCPWRARCGHARPVSFRRSSPKLFNQRPPPERIVLHQQQNAKRCQVVWHFAIGTGIHIFDE